MVKRYLIIEKLGGGYMLYNYTVPADERITEYEFIEDLLSAVFRFEEIKR